MRAVGAVAICVLALCTHSFAWSYKEHIQLTRLAAARLIANPQTPPAMKQWLTDNVPGLLDMVRRVILDEKASLLVIDGISPARGMADNDVALKEFVVELQMLSGMTNCTTILLAAHER